MVLSRWKILGLFVFISLICSSCIRNKNVSFDVIDATIFDGWYCINSIRIEKNGYVHILTSCITKGQKFYTTTLNNDVLDTISDMANNLFTERIDTFYNNDCCDCGAFRLIVKSADKRIETAGIGLGKETNETAKEFIKYLKKIISKTENTYENQLQFESKTREFYPVPPPPVPQHL